MIAATYPLSVYLHLAAASTRRQRYLVRDRLLVLAAKAALAVDYFEVAEGCFQFVRRQQPGHLWQRWPSLAQAMAAPEVQTLFERMEQLYPLERAEHLASTLQLDLANVAKETLELAAALDLLAQSTGAAP